MNILLDECHNKLFCSRIDITIEYQEQTHYYSYTFKNNIAPKNWAYAHLEDDFTKRIKTYYPQADSIKVKYIYPQFETVYTRFKCDIQDDKQKELLLYQLENNYYYIQAQKINYIHNNYSEAQNIISIIKRNEKDIHNGYYINLVSMNDELKSIYNRGTQLQDFEKL